MTILIDPTSTTPLYEQIVQQIQRQILSGTLPQGELLPGVRTLAADLSVSIITTRRAYEELERGRIHQNTARTGQHCKH